MQKKEKENENEKFTLSSSLVLNVIPCRLVPQVSFKPPGPPMPAPPNSKN